MIFAASLAGCASFSKDGGGTRVGELTQSRIGETAAWQRTDTERDSAQRVSRELLARPLSADGAVKLALLNNRGLQAAFAELGIAESDLVQAGRLRNPGFIFERLRRADDIDIGRLFLFDVLGLVTMPLRTQMETRRFGITQERVAADVLQLAANTRRAWVAAVAAREAVNYAEQVNAAAEASAELARRMAAAGNFSKLDHAREQVFYAEAAAQLARARQVAVAEREKLTRLLGLWGEDTRFQLPVRLPDLPKSPRDIDALESTAVATRLDVRMSMREAEHLAASMGLTRATGFLSVLEVGYQRNSETSKRPQTGYEIELRLPIFDWGGARVARAEHTYMQAVHRAADTAVRARSEVREAWSAYRTAFDLARHYRDEIVPLRKHISEEVLLRYNGMLMSVFELLVDARQQIAAVSAAIDAQRDFWLAEANLNMALTGKSPGTLMLSGGAAASATTQAGH
jgi:outer membrane protein TolC